MRAVIIGNGDIKNYGYIKSLIKADDYIICADGGLRHLKGLGINADIAMGDFDSAEAVKDIRVISYPIDKDLTDGEIAVNYAIRNGYSEILMIAMTGSRLDHTLTNIMLLTKSDKMCLIDDINEIYVIRDELEITDKKGKTLSIIPINGNLTSVHSEGLKYELNGETLFFATGKGNSNIITDNFCRIRIKEGIGMVIINNGE